MSDKNKRSLIQGTEPDSWPHEPPPELLEALDHAAARLSDLDAHGVRISLGIGADGGPLARVSQEGLACEVDSSLLLQLVCGSKLRVPRASAV